MFKINLVELLSNKISKYNRKRKWRNFLKIIDPGPHLTVLDAGFGESDYNETANYLEKHWPYPQNITALGVDMPIKFSEMFPLVKAIRYDGRSFPFEDRKFDICWSNAVIEHVGDRDRQILFLKEIKRVSKKAFITTPNRYFPVEVHTLTPLLHFFPKRIFDRYLTYIGKGDAAGSYMNLLSFREIQRLLKDAGIFNYRIMRNRLLFFTLDFVVILD